MKHINLLIILSVFVLASCGSDDAATPAAATPTLASISAVPKSTGPVVSSGSLNWAGLVAGRSALATTGETFATATANAWQAGDSRAFCESVGLVKDLFGEASEPDTISCYLGTMESTGLISDPFDGADHYAELTGMSDGPPGVNPKIKYNISKDSAGLINSFKMWMCFGANAGVQTGYVELTIASGAVTVVSKNTDSFSEGGSTFTYSGDVSGSGTVNSFGQWLTKSITANRRFAATGAFSDTFGSSATLTQTNSDIEVNGFFAGSRDSGGGAETFSNNFFSVMQIVNATNMTSFALGDGSSKYSIAYNGPGGNDTFGPVVDSWLGDTRGELADATTGDFYTRANAGTPVAVGAVPSVSFIGAQAWDCNAASTFTAVDFSSAAGVSAEALMVTCDSKYGGNRDWVDCNAAD